MAESSSQEGAPRRSLPSSHPRSYRSIVRLSGLLALLGVGALLVTVVTSVLGRWMFGRSLPGSLDLVQHWYMAMIGFGGLAVAQANDEHITVSIVTERLGPRMARATRILGLSATLLVACALGYYSVAPAVRATAIGERGIVTDILLWPTRWLPLIGFGFFAGVLAIDIWMAIKQPRRPPRPGADAHNG